MNIFWKICAAGLISLVLMLLVEKQEKHIAALISIATCCVLIAASAEYLKPIIRLMRQLQRTAALDRYVFDILLKSVAVSVICEIASLICTESGYASLGKVLQNAGIALILYLSLPLFSELLDLVSELLGGP